MGQIAELDDACDRLAVRSPGPRFKLELDQRSLWKEAMEKYKKDFDDDLSNEKDDFARRLTNATSYEELLDAVQGIGQRFERSREGSKAWRAIRDALKPVVRVVLMFTDAVADEVSIPGGKVIFAAIGILLRTTQTQSRRLDTVSDLFDELSQFLMRLDVRKDVPYNKGSRTIAVDIFVQLLDVMSIATKLIRAGRLKSFVNALVKEDEIQKVLQKLKTLIDYEHNMTTTETFSAVHRVEIAQRSGQIETKNVVESTARESRVAILTAIERSTRTRNRERPATRGDIQAVVSICRRLEASAAFQPSSAPRPSCVGKQSLSPSPVNLTEVALCAFRKDPVAAAFCLVLLTASCMSNHPGMRATTAAAAFIYMLQVITIQHQLPPKIYESNTITLIDLLGTKISLGVNQCESFDMLHQMLLGSFKNKKCEWFVQNRQYELVKAGDAFQLTRDTWKDIICAGVEIVMNALVVERRSKQSVACPSCQAPWNGQSGDDSWAECHSCSRKFKVSEPDSNRFEEVLETSHKKSSPTLGTSSPQTQRPPPTSATRNRVEVDKAPRARGPEPPPLSPPLDDLRWCQKTRIILEKYRSASKFDSLGETSDLEQAISLASRAVELTPEGHSDMPQRLNDLATMFERRFDRLGEMGDLERAILLASRAVELTPEGHPHMPRRLNDLAMLFGGRFDRLGEMGDLEQAILLASRAVELTPEGHPHMPRRLNDLAMLFGGRFDRLGETGDLEQAILLASRAVELTPEGHPHMPRRLNDLGTMFERRFDRLGEMGDLEQAILLASRAVELTPEGHPHMPRRLNDLAMLFGGRFDRLGEMGDLERAISLASRAVDLTPEGHPAMPQWLNDLADLYRQRFDQLGEAGDRERAVELKSRADKLRSALRR